MPGAANADVVIGILFVVLVIPFVLAASLGALAVLLAALGSLIRFLFFRARMLKYARAQTALTENLSRADRNKVDWWSVRPEVLETVNRYLATGTHFKVIFRPEYTESFEDLEERWVDMPPIRDVVHDQVLEVESLETSGSVSEAT